MTLLEFKLTVVSPMFLNGADTRQPEPRAASVRGQLRYWLRAYLGAQTDDLKRIWEDESAIFGSTEKGAAVSVRLFGGDPGKEEYAMLPHRSGRRDQLPQKAIPPDFRMILQLATRPGVEVPQRAISALKLWALLGGLGKRSRRMFGAFSLSGQGFTQPASVPEYCEQLEDALKAVSSTDGLYSRSIPSFPTLHRAHSWIIIGRSPFDTYEEAVKHLFTDLLRSGEFINKSTTFGSASPRRSSPLIAQVRKIGENYYPILTAIRSKPDSTIDWSHLKKLMETATQKRHFDAEKIIWGGW